MILTEPIVLPRKVTAATATKRLPTSKELPCSDGEPLETSWHVNQMLLFLELIAYHWRGRKDYFAGGDMFMYFSEEHVFNKDFRGPDFFVVKGVDHDKDRDSWVSWEEGDRLPDVIVELLSPSTKHIDRTVKKRLYDERFETAEYFCIDPAEELIEGWRRNGQGYEPIAPDEDGRLWSRELEVSFDWWTGLYLERRFQTIRWVRMFDVHGNMAPTFKEGAEAELQGAEAQLKGAEAQLKVTESQKHVVETRLNTTEGLLNTAEAEVERLKKEIETLRQQSKPTTP